MRFLHTSDWHVGKVLKGHDRLDEHRAVLAEIVAIADEQRVDAVFVVGDLFETALPSPDAQQLVWETLIALRRTGAEVIVVAGNHDNAGLFEAMSALFAAIGITMVGRPRRPNAGGIVRFSARETGEPVEVALLPFVSQRGIVTSLHLMGEDMAAAQLSQTYALRMQRVISALSDAFTSDAIRVFLVHAHVHGGLLGGGEREAQTIFDYGISPAVFPTTAHYVGLGHLHRMQKVAGPCPIHYCGSPVQVDFGEEADSKQVLLVEVSPRTPARATPVRLTQPRVLRTVEGSESELRQRQGEFVDLPDRLQWFGLNQVAGQRTLILTALALLILLGLALRHLAAGRFIYAVGSDVEAARLAGIRPQLTTFFVFVFMGALVGLAALMNVVQSPQVDPKSGSGLELKVIAAAVVGGVGVSGGRGRLWGVFVGLLLLACINPALTHLHVAAYWEKAVQGTFILLAVVADGWSTRKQSHSS